MPIRKGLLPREGFVIDPVVKLLGRTALNPALLLPLVLLARYTKRGSDLAILHPRAFRRLKSLLYFALATSFSNWLSRKVQNNWTPSTKFNWPRELVVVTGGSGGIGGHVSRLLAEKGATVAVLDLQPLTWDVGRASIHHFHCDVTSPASIATAARDMRARFDGRDPTVLINNAGVLPGKTILDAKERDIRLVLNVNTLSHYWTVREFLPSMISANRGTVVTVASTAGFVTAPNMTEYASSKAAAIAFHEGLAVELKTRYRAPRVRTLLVCPGKVKTLLTTGYDGAMPFLVPDLEPETVAEELVVALQTGESGRVIIPRAIGVLLPALRVLPQWLQFSMRTTQAKLMVNFSGRQVEQGGDAREKRPDTEAEADSSGSAVSVGGK